MARLSRLVIPGIPGIPHHVTQRGNGRAQTFFSDEDCALYRDWLGESCRANEQFRERTIPAIPTIPGTRHLIDGRDIAP